MEGGSSLIMTAVTFLLVVAIFVGIKVSRRKRSGEPENYFETSVTASTIVKVEKTSMVGVKPSVIDALADRVTIVADRQTTIFFADQSWVSLPFDFVCREGDRCKVLFVKTSATLSPFEVLDVSCGTTIRYDPRLYLNSLGFYPMADLFDFLRFPEVFDATWNPIKFFLGGLRGMKPGTISVPAPVFQKMMHQLERERQNLYRDGGDQTSGFPKQPNFRAGS